MPADYVQVLADLDEQIAHHKKEMEELQAARPAIVALRNKFNPILAKPYTGVGPTAAIRDLLSKSNAWHSTQEIVDLLVSKGWTTDSAEPARVISSTLSQMKTNGLLDKKNDMWKWSPNRDILAIDSTVLVSPGAANSLGETILKQRPMTSVS